ncbi:MAG: T9SS type A sorting domain-containing protein [Paludibacter sp.]|nr:T9SS type A sorting domain-containing protein [Paludibacter sp.]
MTIYNCSSYNNGYNYGFTNNTYGTLIIKNSASLTTAKSNSFNCKSVTQAFNTWNSGFSCVTADFVSLDKAQMLNDRKSDGSLPEITLLHLTSTSGMIDKGTNVGFPFLGVAPDLGAFEYSITNAIQPTFSNGSLKIYPNPVNEKAIISLDASSNDALTIQFYDMTGRMIFNLKETITAGKNEFEINTEFLSKGNYICKIQGKEVYLRFKLTK